MIRIVAELPASELPVALTRLLPSGAAAPGARFRVTAEQIEEGDVPVSGLSLGLDGVAAGLVDVESNRMFGEDELFTRLLAKYAHPDG